MEEGGRQAGGESLIRKLKFEYHRDHAKACLIHSLARACPVTLIFRDFGRSFLPLLRMGGRGGRRSAANSKYRVSRRVGDIQEISMENSQPSRPCPHRPTCPTPPQHSPQSPGRRKSILPRPPCPSLLRGRVSFSSVRKANHLIPLLRFVETPP